MLSSLIVLSLLASLTRATAPEIIHQFPPPTWLENLALFPAQNAVLATEFTPAPNLWLVPLSGAAPLIVHNFAPKIAVTGITTSPDGLPGDFFVLAGNFSLTAGTTPGSWSVYAVSFPERSDAADVRELVQVAESGILNGMTVLPAAKTLLVADSAKGLIWEVDPLTGKHGIFLDVPEMKPDPAAASSLGVNGVKVYESDHRGGHYHKSFVYWTNSALKLVCRVRLLPKSGRPTGPVQVLHNGTEFDDFAVDADGNAYLAGGTSNTVDLLKRTKSGLWVLETFAGSKNETILAGTTALAFDEGKKNLYVTTNGGLIEPVNGTLVGGEVVKIELDCE